MHLICHTVHLLCEERKVRVKLKGPDKHLPSVPSNILERTIHITTCQICRKSVNLLCKHYLCKLMEEGGKIWSAQNRINAVQGQDFLNIGLETIFSLAQKKGNFCNSRTATIFCTSRTATIFSERTVRHGNISLFTLFPRCFCLSFETGSKNECEQTSLLTLRRLMPYIYIYGAPILDVSRSHTTTQHSR